MKVAVCKCYTLRDLAGTLSHVSYSHIQHTQIVWKLLHHSEAGQIVGSWTEASAVDPGMRVVPGRARPSELTKRSPEGVTRFSGHGTPLTSKVLDMSGE